METQLIIEKGIPLPLGLSGSCQRCHRRDRVAPYKSCDECRKREAARIQARKDKDLCTYSPCANRPKEGHVMCADHLQDMLVRSGERRTERIKARLCVECGNRPMFWGQCCVICRQKYADDPLPSGARKALARYRRQGRISARRDQALIAVDWAENTRIAKIFTMRHGLSDGIDRTLEEVGAVLSVTRERVRQIEAKHLRWLASEGFDVSLLRPPFGDISREPFTSRRHLVSDEKRKHSLAHGLVARALDDGELIKGSCEFVTPDGTCKSLDVVGHHGDYDKPLEVEWLCRKHHVITHRQIRRSKATW